VFVGIPQRFDATLQTLTIFFRVAKQSGREARKIASHQLSTRQPLGWRLLLACQTGF
jgi:hypothetical protein